MGELFYHVGCFSLFCFDPYRVTELRNKLGRWDGGGKESDGVIQSF